VPALALQLSEWGHGEVESTAYLANGATVTSSGWEVGADGLLSFEGSNGVLIILDPTTIVAVHPGKPADRDPSFVWVRP
jgi:hypothetical protein